MQKREEKTTLVRSHEAYLKLEYKIRITVRMIECKDAG